MGTKLLSSSGGKEFDGTDYIYVYGDSDPLTNGEELQNALYQAGTDKAITGRRQTVVVGPGTYYPGKGGFVFDAQATSMVSLTGNKDVNLKYDIGYDAYMDLSYIPTNKNNTALGDLYEAAFGNRYAYVNDRCRSGFIGIDDNTGATLHSLETGSGLRFGKVYPDGSHFLGPILSGMSIYSYYVKRYGKIYLSAYYAGGPKLMRIDPNTLGIDSTFNMVTLNGDISDIAVPDTGFTNEPLYVSGSFTIVNGYSRVRIAKISDSGILDLTFNPGLGFNNQVYTLCLDEANNNLFVGGYFNTYDGVSSNYIAALDMTTAAMSLTPATPNNAVTKIIKLNTSNDLHVFGYFNYYAGNFLPGRSAVIKNDGTYLNPYLDNQLTGYDYRRVIVNPFYKDSIVIYNGQTQVVNGTNIPLYSIVFFDKTGNVINSENWSMYGSYYGSAQQPQTLAFTNIFQNNLFWKNNFDTGLLPIVKIEGYTFSSNDSILIMSGINCINSSILTDFDTQYDAIFQNLSFNTIYSAAGYSYPGSTNGAWKLINCQLRNYAICGAQQLTISNTNIQNGMFNSQLNIDSQFLVFINGLTIEDNSYVQNAYSGYNIGAYSFVWQVMIKNSRVRDSFRDLTSESFAGRVSNIDIRNSEIEYSFNNSNVTQLYIYNCRIIDSFNNTLSTFAIDTIINDLNYNWTIRNVVANGLCFVYDYSQINTSNINPYSGYMTLRVSNFTGESGNFFSFIGISSNSLDVICENINCTQGYIWFPYGSFYIRPYLSPTTDSYTLQRFKFVDCHVEDVQTAFAVEYVLLSSRTVSVQNVYFENCSLISSQNNSVDGTAFTVSPYKFISTINTPTLTFYNIVISNCSVVNMVSKAFFSGIDYVIALQINNCAVSNSSFINQGTSGCYAFFSSINVLYDIYVNYGGPCTFTNSIAVSSVTESDNVETRVEGFFAKISAGTFQQLFNLDFSFVDCKTDSGFLTTSGNWLPMTPNFYARNCRANNSSFGKGFYTLRSRMYYCHGGYGSFGDVYLSAGNNYSNTTNSIIEYCKVVDGFGVSTGSSGPYLNGGTLNFSSTNGSYTSVVWATSNYNI